ncbi:MAG: amidophosphoribosyltransferase [Pseudomonadota bacterium]
MCGIIGILGQGDVCEELFYGLNSIQHRGQDAAGIVTFDETFRMAKGLGLVNSVFKDPASVRRLTGSVGIGHVRYSTIGSNEALDAQPFFVNYPFGLAMAHNGNVNNFQALRRSLYEDDHRLLDSSCDLELILYALASELEKKDLKHFNNDDLFDAVEAVQRRVQGAYSTITIIANRGLLAFADPYGIRPVVFGRKDTGDGTSYAFASESTCLDDIGFELVRDLEPGEVIFIDNDGQVHSQIRYRERQAFCVFEYIYFAKEDSTIHGRGVAHDRVDMGRALARTFRRTGLRPDVAIDVPSSAYFFASGLAEELGIPYRRGLSKNNFVGRSFISPTQTEREKVVRLKHKPLKDVVRGRKIAVVDDSIVRGTTSRHLVRLLREAGAAEVYLVSASPPIRHPCVYGIDMSIRREMIASDLSVKEISERIGADALVYQRLSDLRRIYRGLPICDACFSGEYPTGITAAQIQETEMERECSKDRSAR